MSEQLFNPSGVKRIVRMLHFHHRTRRGHFPIGGQWWPDAYLARIRRYGALKILGSRVWPFGVT